MPVRYERDAQGQFVAHEAFDDHDLLGEAPSRQALARAFAREGYRWSEKSLNTPFGTEAHGEAEAKSAAAYAQAAELHTESWEREHAIKRSKGAHKSAADAYKRASERVSFSMPKAEYQAEKLRMLALSKVHRAASKKTRPRGDR